MTGGTMKLFIIALLVALLGSVAHAQEGDADYASPLRGTWQDEVRKDPTLKAEIEDALRHSVHERESATFTRNNKHVVMAYIAIWVLTAGFVLWAFLRQQALKAEIARLRADLAKALKDEAR
jgi:hypothetical protein